MPRRKRALTTYYRGDRHPSTKITNEQLRQIYVLIDNGIPQTIIARVFGVSDGTISDYSTGRKRPDQYRKHYECEPMV